MSLHCTNKRVEEYIQQVNISLQTYTNSTKVITFHLIIYP
ncbi:hypothetical protein PFFCH_03960 [Plasmodium falciparum FCH/4]|uniref:Uncharacterized protein n=1 Tax=Plasmodium falciparum FCH/4 TaxID=1036724 RepID=A0A024VIP8_PLAFA|nr:hypothetical protein PFFCH_03960 [Plasmodium falciparum FCH/4]